MLLDNPLSNSKDVLQLFLLPSDSQGQFSSVIKKFYAEDKNISNFENEYLQLHVMLDSLDMDVTNETLVYQPGTCHVTESVNGTEIPAFDLTHPSHIFEPMSVRS